MKKLFTLLFAGMLCVGAYAQYCIPSYTIGTTSGDSITEWSVGTFVANYPSVDTGYADFTATDTLAVIKGQTYTADFINNPTWPEEAAIYIDFNQDSVFDMVTEFMGQVVLSAGGVGTLEFTIPATATLGVTRLRMASVYFPGAQIDPCGTFTFGETEDYSINILPPSDNDVGITSIETYVTVGLCPSLGLEPVTVEIANFGLLSQDTIPVGYSVNGGTPVSETYIGFIDTLDVDTFTFATLVDLSTPNTTYTIQVWTALASDTTNVNDTLTYVVVTPPAPINIFPYCGDFEDNGALSPGWVQDQNDGPQDWAVWTGPTTSFNTGPPGDHTTGTGFYMYVEDSGLENDSVTLLSPCFDISMLNQAEASFWYHSHNADGVGAATENTMVIDLIDNGSLILGIDTIGHDSTNMWQERFINLAGLSGVVGFRFRVNNNNGWFSHDIAIDDFKMNNLIPQDAGVIEVSGVASDCGLSSSETLGGIVENFGTDTLFGVDVSYTINGVAGPVLSLTDTIAPDSTVAFTFPMGIDLSTPGTYNICVFSLNVVGDVNVGNDTTCVDVESIPILSTFPYFEDFESGVGGWTAGAVGTAPNTWAFGTPAKGVIVGASSGVNAWVTGGLGTGDYSNNENSFVLGPCFDFSNLVKPMLRLDVWWNSEFNFDGSNVQTSTDGGASWQNVGAFGDPNNWYNNNLVFGSPGGTNEGWSGRNLSGNGSGMWVTAEHEFNGLAGEPSVLVRVTFGADASITDDGFAFDNVNIFEAPPFNLKAGDLISPVSGCGLSDSAEIKVEYFHVGSQALDSVVFNYSVDGGPTVSEMYPDTIFPSDTACYIFQTTYDFSVADTYNVSFWIDAPGDTDSFNDSTLNVEIIHKAPISTFPYFQDFEGPGFIPLLGSPGIPVITLAEGWENSQDDDFQDWAPKAGPTSSTGTGPNVDHTTGTSTGKYLYVEDSGFENDSVILLTPCFDVSGMNSPKATFWYHSNNNDGPGAPTENEMHVDLLYNGTLIFDIVPPIIHKDDFWNLVEVDLSAYIGTIGLRFRTNNNNGWFSHDIAIDDFGIVDVLQQDVGVIDLYNPQTGCGLGIDSLQFGVANLGTDSVNGGFNISYQINGGVITTVAVGDTIGQAGIIVIPLGPEDFSTPGTYTIKAWTSGLSGDTNFFNDTLCVDVTSIPIVNTYPYSEDFESGDGGWISEGMNNSWVLATPANFVINYAASGVNSWITNDSSIYNNNEQSAVVSPCFDFTNLTLPVIEFAIWWEAPFGDGAVLQSSIDGGSSWQVVGAVGDPTNWYNSTFLSGNPGGQPIGWGSPTFGAGSGDWVIAKHTLDSLGGLSDVRLRVAFGSNAFTQEDGFAFDDIFIYDTPDDDMATLSFDAPSAKECSSDSTEVWVTITNSGLQSQTNVPVEVDYSGAATGSLSTILPGPIDPGDTLQVLVGTINTNAAVGIYDFTAYTSLAGDALNFNDTVHASTEIILSQTVPVVIGDSVCQTDSAQLTLVAQSSSNSIIWLDDTLGNPQILSDTFVTPFITSTTTFYAQAADVVPDLSLTSTFAGGNGQAGNMFDLTPLAGGIIIDSFDIHIGSTTQEVVEIYYATEPFAGVQADPTQWTLLGTDTVTGAGIGNPTGVSIGGLNVPPGVTWGIYVTLSTSTNIDYTNGVNGDFAANADLQLDFGVGVSYPFGPSFFSVRIFNGTIHYSSIGCPSDPVPVQAVMLPPAMVDLGPDAVTCAGFVVDAAEPNLVSYVWNTTETTSSIVVDTSGTYYVDVVDINGCAGSDTINLNILPSPSVEFGSDSIEACGMTTLDAGNPGSTFVWSVPGQFGQTLDVDQTGTYWVEADQSGCTDSDTIYVSILPEPDVDLGGAIASCIDVTLDAGNPGSTYSWSTNETTQTITVTPSMAGADTITVTVTSANGCEVTDEVIITFGAPPTVDLGPDSTYCDSVVLDAGNAGATYMWMPNGETSQTIVANTAGTYSVTVTDSVGCESSDTVDIGLNESPTASPSFDWPAFGYTIDFFANATPGATVSWDFGDGTPVDNNDTTSHTYAFDGVYTVTLTVTNECGEFQTTFDVGPVSIDELFSQSIELYPNPTQNTFVIRSEDLTAGEVSIEVFNARGQIIYTYLDQNVVGLEHQVDLSEHPEGVYMVKISDGERHATKRVVRE